MNDLVISGASSVDPIPSEDRSISHRLVIRQGLLAGADDDGDDIERHLSADGLFVTPGFIDLQVNGGYGIDLAVEPHRLAELGRRLVRHGITAWLPTLVSSSAAARRAFLDAIASDRERSAPVDAIGAISLGAHLEGPVINPEFRGAHRAEHIVTAEHFAAQLTEMAAGTVRLLTVAPEQDGVRDLICLARERGIAVSVGHTGASAEKAHDAADAGATYATHLFNRMPRFHHREPGAIAAVLVDNRFTAGLIVDGVHLHDDTVRLAWHLLGPGRTSLVSDATAALGASNDGTDGVQHLGDERLVIGDDVRTADGTLAGTNLALDRAVRGLIRITGCDLADAVTTVTEVPARLLGDAERGHLRPGLRGDLAILDAEANVRGTIISGEVAWTDGSMTWK